MDWDPGQYLRYADERLRPFVELVQRIDAPAPARVVDLGCGPGNATALLAQRWPDAQILGVDNSPEMIDRANAAGFGPTIAFVLGDAARFAAPGELDVIVSNATFQWVPGHLEHLPALVDSLRPSGTLAFQVPAMADSPSHSTLHRLARDPRWCDRLEPHIRDNSIEPASAYRDVLEDAGCTCDIWETTYHHVLQGEDAVFEWTRGTSLRPFLEALSAPEAEEFGAAFRSELRRLYPAGRHGTVYPFHRLFVVARRRP